MTAATPTQVLSSRLTATPEQVWARVRHSAFIGDYLGARLPAADLAPGTVLQGTERDGGPLAITVTEALAPCSLTLRLVAAGRLSALRLSISACAQGSRLTLLHDDHAEAAVYSTTGLAQGLAAMPAALLSTGAVVSAEALAAAHAYLTDTATAVDVLRTTMAPRQGYDSPPGGGFSLVQHLWHLADVEEFGWSQRFSRLLAEPAPVLAGVDGDRLAVERQYQQRPWRAAARRFLRLRRITLAALARCDAAVLARPVSFSGQAATGGEMLAALVAHDHEHRLAMADAWAALPPAQPPSTRTT